MMETAAVALIAALVPLGLANVGALIYFAGVVSATLKAHDRVLDDHGNRITNLEVT